MKPTQDVASLTRSAHPGQASEASPRLEDPRVLAAVEEYLAAKQAGERPDRQAFLDRHPDLAPALADCLDGLDLIENAVPLLHPSGPPSPDRAAETLLPEGALGDYRLVREIGRGGMGVVYEAVQISLGRQVALKVLPFAATLDAKQLKRFKNEAQAAAQLHHQHIVPIHGVGCARGVHYYAMQFIDGQTLAALIRELRHPAGPTATPPGEPTSPYQAESAAREASADQTATPPVAAISTERSAKNPAVFHTLARLGIQAAEALEHAHAMGVIHRDIKPANLMMDLRGNLWITDFGLAHCQSQAGLTMSGDLVGTLRYMSPEQAMAKRVLVDQRTDIYSLGATLYELLTLEPAFAGVDRQELLRQIAFEEPRPLRRLNKVIPAELETIVLKAIEKNPNDRYASAQELADDLQRFLKDQPIRARRPSLWQKGTKWARRNRAAVRTAVAALVFLLAAVAIVTSVAAIWIREAWTVADKRADQIDRDLKRLNVVNSLVESGRFHADIGEWAKADMDFTKAVECGADNSAAWAERGQFYLRLGLWDLGGADFAKAFQIQEPESTHTWYMHALLRAYLGDTNGYGQLCQRMEQRFGGTTNPLLADQFARTCLLTANPLVDPARLVQLAKLGVAQGMTPWRLNCLGTAYYRAGQYQPAVECIGESMRMDPDWEKTCNYAILAMANHRLGQADLARRNLNVAGGSLWKQWRHPLVGKAGGGYRSWWNVVESSVHFREAKLLIDGSPPRDDPSLWWNRGGALAAVGHANEAVASFTKAIELNPRFTPARLARSDAYRSLGRWDKAISDLEQAILLAPTREPGLAWLLATCPPEIFRDPQRAIELAQKGVARAPRSGPRWTTLGVAHYRAGNWQAAVKALMKATELRQGVGGANDWFFLAMAHWRLDQKKLAREWFTYAVQRAALTVPRHDDLLPRFHAEAAALLGLPETLPRLPQPQPDAVAFFTLVLGSAPDAAWAYERRRTAYAWLGQWDKAAADYARADWSGPLHEYAFEYACLFQIRGDLAGYDKFCQRMIQRAGQTKNPYEAYVLARSCAMARKGLVDRAQAVQWGEQAVASDRMQWYLHALGLAQYRAGQFDQALQSFTQANVGTWQSRDVNWFGLALAHHGLGHTGEARQCLRKGIQWFERQGPKGPEDPGRLGFRDWLAGQLLRREAEELLAINKSQ